MDDWCNAAEAALVVAVPVAGGGLDSKWRESRKDALQNRWGQNLRLEQERIDWDLAWRALSDAAAQ